MRITILSHHHLFDNPRVVREAEALAEAGHAVRIVAVRKAPWASVRDAGTASGRGWRLQQVNIERRRAGRRLWLLTGLRQKLMKALWKRTRWPGVAGRAYCRTFDETVRMATAEPNDLVIGHTQPMLAVASAVARKSGCVFGFDIEDILSEELGEGIEDPHHRALVEYVEGRFLPEAAYLTAASPLFATWAAEKFGLPKPTTILNVFSLRDVVAAPLPGFGEVRDHLSLHWWGGTVSLHRGLADAVRALPHVRVPCRLHVRGTPLPGVTDELVRLAAGLGVAGSVTFHPVVPPEELIRGAAVHDVGLALMQPHCLNHQLAVPNKLFSYMAAGLAVVATATAGHKSVLRGLEGPRLYPPGEPEKLAACLNDLVGQSGRLMETRHRCLRLAREVFNWDAVKGELVRVVESVQNQRAAEVSL